MSFSEGSVVIEVRGPSDVACHSTRTEAVCRALAGKPWESQMPKILIGSLYALCPQAQLAGYRAALARAVGAPVPEDVSPRAALEMAGEHLRFIAFDAPRMVGLAPDPEIRRIGELRTVSAEEFAKDAPGLTRLAGLVRECTRHFVTGCDHEAFSAVSSLTDFEDWMHGSGTAAARLLAALFDGVPCRPFAGVPFLAAHTEPEEAERWFAAGISAIEPAACGEIRQTSALERWLGHPLICAIREQYGCYVRAAFAARILDLLALAREELPVVVRSAGTAPDTGIAVVECARGTLVTRVAVREADRTLGEVRIIAPTEWNFRPGGAAGLMLSALGATGEEAFRSDAAWILAAADPCVPGTIRFA